MPVVRGTGQVGATMISRWFVVALVFGAEALSADGVQTPQPRVATRESLPFGQLVEDQVAPDERPSYPLRLEAGSFLRDRAAYRDVELSLQLIGPDQTPRYQEQQLTLSWIAETAGEYRIEVVTPRRRVHLGYAIVLQELRAAEPLDQKRLEAQRLHDEAAKKKKTESEEGRREAILIVDKERALWHEAGDRVQE